MFIGNGNQDGTGDGVMIAKDVQELAHTYCQRGVNVQFNVYDGLDHDTAVAPFEAGALTFITQLFAGQQPANRCGSIATGNALTPLPAVATPKHRHKQHKRRHHHKKKGHRRSK